ncbi:glycine/betaine ABC transporter [Ventosimonas gracilis]|uniref:Glycine/betaine ABC transporter n=1 Tax=Ventosimonas gracilis TaxID=1680762 RepID=A0A139ST64_9GAMM|nr:glycine/betaine ABC transporter [Ventosimonas gracilis]
MSWLSGALLALLFGFSAHAQDKVIKMGSITYVDTLPLALISKKMLELEGHKVELTTFSEQGILFAALAKGDIEITPNYLNYVNIENWKKYNRRLEKVSVVTHGLYQCLVVPSYVPINSIEELNSVKEQMGGKIIGIETGSGLYRETEQAVKAYGLDYQVVAGSTPTAIAELHSALERKAPIVTMLWDPTWMMAKYDVKFLKDPKGIFAPPQSMHWIANKGFSAKNPHAREVLASIYVPIEDVRAINEQINDGMSMDEAIDHWWKNNEDLVKRWQVMSSR